MKSIKIMLLGLGCISASSIFLMIHSSFMVLTVAGIILMLYGFFSEVEKKD